MDEVGGDCLVILTYQTILSDEVVEVQELHVGSLGHGLAYGCLSTGLWSEEAHALRQDGFLGLSVDVSDGAGCINVVHLSEVFVIVDDGKGLVEVVLHSLLDGLLVVVSAAARLSPLHASLLHQRLWHVVEENLVSLNDVLLEVDGLVDSSREAVDQICLGRVGDQAIDQDLYGQLERHESTFLHDLLDLLSLLRSLGHLRPHEIARRNVREAELLNDLLALRSFAGGWTSQNKDDLRVAQ